MKKRRAIKWLVFTLIVCGAVVAGVRFVNNGFLEAVSPEKKPNIVLISIDTLRADFFSEEHMPKTVAWAENNCVIFEAAHANSTWTLPAHVTMLTGLLQREHGVEYYNNKIPENIPMAQEQLQKAGYFTVGLTGGGFIDFGHRFHRGFDKFMQLNRQRHENDSFEMAKKLLSEETFQQPVFMFIHTYQAHDYLGKPPFDKEKFDLGLTPEELVAAYSANLKDFDLKLMELIEAICNSPIGDDLRMIITSDHGEGFDEKITALLEGGLDPASLPRNLFHGQAPYTEQTHIPLIVYGEGKGRVKRLVGLDAVAGAILEWAGLPANTKTLSAKNSELISEYIHFKREDAIRYTSVIKATGRYTLNATVDENQSKNPTFELTEEEIAELKALGYLK
jgi:arylsulfatase A-like enzyme